MNNRHEDLHFIGNKDILKNHKTAFLCSRNIPASIVLKTYDWAIHQRNQGRCIISGFHSAIEKDVLHYLLKGTQPVIMALARGFKQRFPAEIKQALNEKRLLIMTPFESSITRITSQTALQRNLLMIDLADEILVAYASPHGMLRRLVQDKVQSKKKIFTLDVPENREMIRAGIGVIN